MEIQMKNVVFLVRQQINNSTQLLNEFYINFPPSLSSRLEIHVFGPLKVNFLTNKTGIVNKFNEKS